jgi:hypothetical protein
MLLVGQEEVPETLGLRVLADLDEDVGLGLAGPDLLVERAQRLELDRIDVFVEERRDPLAQLLDPLGGREVHAREAIGPAPPRRPSRYN